MGLRAGVKGYVRKDVTTCGQLCIIKSGVPRT